MEVASDVSTAKPRQASHDSNIQRFHRSNNHHRVTWFEFGIAKTFKCESAFIHFLLFYRLLHTSEICFKVSLAMSPSQRPQGALGFWASLMTALGNTDDLQVSCYGWSSLIFLYDNL